MSKQVEWDALVNARVTQLDNGISRLTAEQTALNARIANLSGGSNADVEALRTQLNSQSTRLGNRITNQNTQKTAAQGRLYASLSAAQQTIVDAVCTNCSEHVQTMLAHSDVDIETAESRVSAGKNSVTTPGSVTQEDEDSLFVQVIQRMIQGV